MNDNQLTTDLIPSREPSNRLMVVLHGLGDSMEGYRDLVQALQIPWLNYLLVNAPDAYYTGYSWFELYGDSLPGIVRSRKLLTTLLDSLRDKFPSDQTLLLGFSQGCLMTLETGLRYPHKLAGLIGISGWIHDDEVVLKELGAPQRVLWTHGTRDPLIPFAQVKDQAARLKASGLDIQWQEYQKEHTIIPRELSDIRAFIVGSFIPPSK